MLVDHEKNALCDGYIVEPIHDAAEFFYEGGIHACRSCNNIKFPLYVLKDLKLYLSCLPMLVDSCSYKLCTHKIPRHKKQVRFKYASHILHDALFMFQFLSFMQASLKSSCLARGVKRQRLLGGNPTLFLFFDFLLLFRNKYCIQLLFKCGFVF